jgi:hypothetical protein
VSATEPHAIPGSIYEELFAVVDRLGVNPVGSPESANS